ncbi:MAG: hypothetical protein ACE361_05935 [Aureliella sp.]
MRADEGEDEELPEFLPGLLATFETDEVRFQKVMAGVSMDAAVDRIDDRLPRGDFKATWSGLLRAKADGEFGFAFFGNGSLEVLVGGQRVLSQVRQELGWYDVGKVELEFGQHPIEVRYAGQRETARLRAFWEGPGFSLEPLESRHLWYPTDEAPKGEFELGHLLSRGLRCGACHGELQEVQLSAPSLADIELAEDWMVRHLTAKPTPATAAGKLERKMPFFEMSPEEAKTIVAALKPDHSSESRGTNKTQTKLRAKPKNKNAKKKKDQPPLSGRRLVASVGCLACHSIATLDVERSVAEQLFGGGDLSSVAGRRSREYLSRLLTDPRIVDANHRMPQPKLNADERDAIVDFLMELTKDARHANGAIAKESNQDFGAKGPGTVTSAKALIARYRCGNCHELPTALELEEEWPGLPPLGANSNWESGCVSQNTRTEQPQFALRERHRSALKGYFSQRVEQTQPHASQMLVENNCVHCHRRGEQQGIARLLPEVAAAFPETASRLAALSPPALTGIGDKLIDSALADAAAGEAETMRPWLDVRMPKFHIDEDQSNRLVEFLIRSDRIPEFERQHGLAEDRRQHGVVSSHHLEQASSEQTLLEPRLSNAATALAGSRLVTSDGFGCQSCHQIGDNGVPKVDLKARGTNLLHPGKRIRASWFQRWVRNPSRIVARMEMPAIQTPAVGILDGDLDRQIDALWQALNAEDFRAPKPNPTRIVRSTGSGGTELQANLVTCVIETPERKYLRPLAIGLPNRHNVLFDMESGSLSGWWIGDTAYQYTRGKTWFWELGNPFLAAGRPGRASQELQSLVLVDSTGAAWVPTKAGQIAVKLDSYRHENAGLRWAGRIHFGRNGQSRWVPFEQLAKTSERGVDLQQFVSIASGESLQAIIAGEKHPISSSGGRPIRINLDVDSSVELLPELTMPQMISRLGSGVQTKTVAWRLRLSSRVTPDHLPEMVRSKEIREPKKLECVPGFEVWDLPLPRREMPVSMAWGPEGSFFIGSLKGNVFRVYDVNGDGFQDTYEQISDSIPTPYGMQFDFRSGGLDVLTKYALMRLAPSGDASEGLWSSTVVADGWGYTADYHDWAVGLERLKSGEYLIALPCQQDQRSQAAANLRGHAVLLRPAANAEQSARAFELESLAAGLRFPMGIAVNSNGDIFASDNQGNYNPFNELNHIRAGKRYGFINKLENHDGFSPSFESPAINLPHPWTRSVNGICFLSSGRAGQFGPYEGHLIGCEMNGRSLVRMTLQKVDGTYQGAAYDFSVPGLPPEETFEGPIVCRVAPDGSIYVGNLHDSGWGGGQNTGSITRLRFQLSKLPLGIVEATATPSGFRLLFSQPIDASKATKASNFRIRSYTRVSTPAYGGDDQDERIESVQSIRISEDKRSVELDLNALRAGYVYEINVGAISPGAENGSNVLFPNTAHYTMRSVPTK